MTEILLDKYMVCDTKTSEQSRRGRKKTLHLKKIKVVLVVNMFIVNTCLYCIKSVSVFMCTSDI